MAQAHDIMMVPLDAVRAWWNREDPPMEPKPLLSHLNALRKTLIVCVIAVAVAFGLVYTFQAEWLVDYITDPLVNQGIEMIFTDVSEAFVAQTKLSLIVGTVLASPVIFGAIWVFIRPALKRKERVYTALTLIVACFLFALGVYFAYNYVFFLAVNFFVYLGDDLASPLLSLGTYVDFLFEFLLPFGATFELPLLVVWLTKSELVTPAELSKARKYVIFGIFLVSAILTPPDVVSQILLSIPIGALFEVGVICSRRAQPRKRKRFPRKAEA